MSAFTLAGAQADLGPALQHRDDHDVGDADAADQQGAVDPGGQRQRVEDGAWSR
jgi:hypothetical protein